MGRFGIDAESGETHRPVMSTTKHSSILALIAILALTAPALGQPVSDLGALLSGKTHPLSMKLKELDTDWRRITVQGSANVTGNVSVNVSGNTYSSSANNASSASHSQNNIVGALPNSRGYVTKGQTVVANGRTYLLAYHLPAFGLDFGALLQALAAKTPPTSAALNPETVLPLSLLDLQTIGSLDDVRVFDLQAEIAESEKAIRLAAGLLKSQGGGSSTSESKPPKSESDK
jgi:hypothetical protein